MQAFLAMALLAVEVDVRPVDFDTQVMPILTKAGCNAGACHGAAAGRGGFHLSLYGSRPQDDFVEITQALEGRRVNHSNAMNSLVLMKPTEQVNHEGGTRLESDGANFEMLRRWIAEGAARREGRELSGFQIAADRTVVLVGETVQLTAVATFSNTTRQNVMPWTVVKADDPSAIAIDSLGKMTVKRSGRHVIVARYLNHVVPLELLASERKASADDAIVSKKSSIDEFIAFRLNQLGLTAVAAAEDGEYLRRLSLDLTGRLPSPAVVASFAADTDSDKRRTQMERYLKSNEFNAYWTHQLAQLFRVAGGRSNSPALVSYYAWIADCVSNNVPFDEIARQLVLADGSLTDNAPANFYAVVQDARAQAEFFSNAFLGVRLQCANCHDHPLDAWTQDDYHGLAAIFAGIKRGPVIRVTTSGEVIHPATGDAAVPKVPGADFLRDPGDHRPALVEWLTSERNPYFSKAIVNRLWSHLMGRGLVEPVDDLRVTNPATHPELLDWLAEDFVEHRYQIRHTIRRICLSEAYGRSSHGKDIGSAERDFYSVSHVKPLSPVVLMDAVSDVTGVKSQFETKSSRAVSLSGLVGKSKVLNLLGRCQSSDCGTGGGMQGNLPVQLHLINGAILNRRLIDEHGLLAQAVASEASASELVIDFYLRALGRRPSATEADFWGEQFSASVDRFEVAQDFLWTLLSSEEFRTNH